MALKQQVDIALPIEFSEVCEVLYQDTAGTSGRSLSQAFIDANADLANRQFNPTYEGAKDRLTNWRGYPVSLYDIMVVSIRNENSSFLIPWSNIESTLVGTNDTDGLANTNAIVSQSGHTTSAAQECLDYTLGGYNDWFLPAHNDLDLFYDYKDEITTTSIVNGGDVIVATYIGSTEIDASTVESINTENDFQGPRQKGAKYPFGPVREFQLSYLPTIGDYVGGGVVIKASAA